MLAVIVLYLLVNFALFSALPYGDLVASESPTALAMERTLGALGGTLLATIVVISTFGSLNGAMLASPRLFYAMGKAGLFFRFTTRVHPVFKTPHLSIVALTGVALVYVAGLGTWERVTEAVSVAFAAFLSLAVVALFVLRRKYPDAERPYRVTGYPYTPLLYLGIIVTYTVTIVASNYQTTLIGIAISAAGLVFYPLFRRSVTEND
jgi:APA family basic amino acid/polyamine antiporter